MVSQTSLLAFQHLKGLGNKQQAVYEALEALEQASSEQIADHLGWSINRVTGRVNELAKLGYFGVDGVTKTKGGFTAKLWGLRDPNDRKLEQDGCDV